MLPPTERQQGVAALYLPQRIIPTSSSVSTPQPRDTSSTHFNTVCQSIGGGGSLRQALIKVPMGGDGTNCCVKQRRRQHCSIAAEDAWSFCFAEGPLGPCWGAAGLRLAGDAAAAAAAAASAFRARATNVFGW
jgi:hypothetical protein